LIALPRAHLDCLKEPCYDATIHLESLKEGADEMADKLDIPQGTLDLMILTILAREPLHGYGISQRLAALSHDHFRVNPGSLFPSLYRLEQDGKLKAEWRATENNRRAKYYRLTASGRKQLDQHRERWTRVSFAVTSVLEGA
jgi:PadR family transcriptional regulator, regulatory protein PadR